jgi:hypothetical protein
VGHGGSSGGAGQKLRISLKERLEYCLGFIIGHSQWDQVVPCFTKIASSVSCQREQIAPPAKDPFGHQPAQRQHSQLGPSATRRVLRDSA